MYFKNILVILRKGGCFFLCICVGGLYGRQFYKKIERKET